MEKLCEIQRNKRCLIVVDDLWEVSHWDGFKHAFLVEDLKSKIFVTTRKRNVADIGFSVELGLLKMDEALELLKKKSFPQGNYPGFALQESLTKISKEMVRKCGYLPLAISLLGGVLSKKSSMREWEYVNSNMDSSIYRGGGHDSKGNQIEQVLNLSYQDLPYFLKPCFLFLARWREDEYIKTEELYRIWNAHGMISYENAQIKKLTLLETAELYLSELASRCLVQVARDDGWTPSLKYKFCRLHDVVRELCVSIGTNENFGVKILEYTGGKFITLLQEGIKTRYLVVHFKENLQLGEGDHATIASGEDSKHIRSLKIQNEKFAEFPFLGQSVVDLQRFKMLKSLKIEGCRLTKQQIRKGITKLVHLKYLHLLRCDLDELPSSISHLTYLEDLSLYRSLDVRIPNVLKKFSRLKHLYLPPYGERITENYRIRMRLDVCGELESLRGFDSSVYELVSITRMKNLRYFSATIRDNESLSTIINIIATEWKELHFCSVYIHEGCELTSDEGQTKLKQVFACPNLYRLVISVRLWKRLAECESDIITSKLVFLRLENSEIEDNLMVVLGKLPSLETLSLCRSSFVREELICPVQSFPSLLFLELSALPYCRALTVENGAMPLLREIRIGRCPKFEKIPDEWGRISTLESLGVYGMPELGRRVMESGEDFHKVCHIPSIIVLD